MATKLDISNAIIKAYSYAIELGYELSEEQGKGCADCFDASKIECLIWLTAALQERVDNDFLDKDTDALYEQLLEAISGYVGDVEVDSNASIPNTQIIVEEKYDGSFIWGKGSGNIEDQTDLMAMFNTKEDKVNKVTTLNSPNNTTYPTTLAVKNELTNKIPRATIAEIRALEGNIIANTIYYTVDQGKEGNWIVDLSDTTSVDNTGTILVTSDGKRFKRILEESGVYQATWFGLSPDGLDSSAVANRDALNNVGIYVESIGGGVIMIPKGTSVFHRTDSTSGNLINFRNNVTYRGYGKDVSILKKINNTGNSFCLTTAKSNFILEDIGFNGGTQTVDVVSVQFDRCFNFIVQNCRFTNMRWAVYLSGTATLPCYNFKILNNYFDSVRDFGVRARKTNSTDIGPYNGLILGNTFVNVTQGIATGEYSAVRVAGTKIIVAFNTILQSFDTGIMFTRSDDCVALGNNVHSQLVGIFTGTYSTNLKIVDNTIESERDFGIHAYNPDGEPIPPAFGTYIGNKIRNTGKSCIYLEASSYNSITGNTLENPGQNIGANDRDKCGISLTSNSNGTVSVTKSDYNTVVGNIVSDTLSTPRMKYGIFEESANAANNIGLNTITGSTSEDVRSTTNTFSVGIPRYRQSNTVIRTSLALSTGETTTAGRPSASTYGANSLLWDTTLQKYIYSNGTTWLEVAPSTNLSLGTVTSTTRDINSSTGTPVTLPSATQAEAGLFSGTDKIKLDNTPLPETGTGFQYYNSGVKSLVSGTNTSYIRPDGTTSVFSTSVRNTPLTGLSTASSNVITASSLVIEALGQLQAQISLRAPLASPTFTGTPNLPTGTIGVTQTAGNNTTALATTAFVQTALSAIPTNYVTTNSTQTGLSGNKTWTGNHTFSGVVTASNSIVVNGGPIEYFDGNFNFRGVNCEIINRNAPQMNLYGSLSNVNLSLFADGTSQFLGALSVPTPVTGNHATNKSYVEGLIPVEKTLTGSGNGSSTTISIPHGLSSITSSNAVIAVANNSASAGISYVTIDATNVNIFYTVAPSSGTNNLKYSIIIK